MKQILLILSLEILALASFLFAVPAESEYLLPWISYFFVTSPLVVLCEISRIREEKAFEEL